MLLLALTPVLVIFDMLPSNLLERNGAFKLLAAGNLTKVAVGTGITIGFALHGASSMSIAYRTLAGSLFGVAYVNVVGWRYASVRLSLHDWRRIMRFGLQMLMVTGVRSISLRLSEILLGRFIGLGALGL